MNPTLKAVLALVFVAALGAVLIQPILDAADTEPSAAPLSGADPTAEPPPTPAPQRSTPSVSPTMPDDSAEAVQGSLRTRRLARRYPPSCRRVDPAAGDSLGIAADTGRRIAFGSPDGPGPLGTIRARRFLGYNATGAVYAARLTDGRVAIVGAGAAPSAADAIDLEALVWSPLGSCGLGITTSGALTLLPGGRELVPGGVESVAYSPDGRRIALVLDEESTASIWVTDPTGRLLREVHRERAGPRISLEAWSPDGRTLYLSFAPGSGLSFVTTDPRPRSGGIVKAPVSDLEQCSGRLLGLVNGAIAEITTGGPVYLTEPAAGAAYTAASCSPDGRYIAAIRDDSLVLLDADGNLLRDLTTDRGYRDLDPDWGDSGSGLLFGRVPDGGGPAQVWHIPEGGVPRNTGLVYRPAPRSLDWSASPPTGLP